MENTCLRFFSQFIGCARLAVLLLGLHILALAGTHLLLVQQAGGVELPVLTDHLRRKRQEGHRQPGAPTTSQTSSGQWMLA